MSATFTGIASSPIADHPCSGTSGSLYLVVAELALTATIARCVDAGLIVGSHLAVDPSIPPAQVG